MKPFSRKHPAKYRKATPRRDAVLNGKGSTAPVSKSRELVLAAVMAIVGTIVGSFVTASIQYNNELKRRQAEGAIAAYRTDNASNTPQEYFDIKMLVDEMRNMATMGDDLIIRLATLNRQYPGCQLAPASFSKACRPYLIETVRAARVAAGGSEVSFEDMNLLLTPKIENAKAAYQRVTGLKVP